MFKRIVTGSALSVFTLMANIVIAIWMMPFIIHNLGNHDYGLWVLVASFIGYYGLLDFGMSTAATRFLSRADGRGDIKEMNTVLTTASIFFAGLGLTIFAISSTVALFSDSFKTAMLWFTVGVTCIFQFGLRGFYGLFHARIRQDIMSYTALTKLAVRTSLIIYFLSNGYGVVAVAVIAMVTELINYAVDMIILRRMYPEMNLTLSYVKKDRIKEMLKYGGFSMITQISDLLRLRALPLIVTYTAGIAYIVYFSIAMRLMEIYYQVIEKVVHILTPVFSQYEGQGNEDQIKRVFWISFRINVVLSILIGAGIIIFANPFIIWWIGPEYTLASTLTVALAIGFMAFTIQQTGKTALFGTGRHQAFALSSMYESILGALVGGILGYLFGPAYIAGGMVGVMIGWEFSIKPKIITRELDISLKTYYLTILEIAAKVGIPLVLFGSWLTYTYGNSISILQMLIFSCMMVILVMPSMWWSLNADSRELLNRKIFSKLPMVSLNA